MNPQNLFPLLTDEGIESFLRDSETGYEEQAIKIYRTYRAYGEIPLVAAISTIQDLIPLISE